MKHLFYIFIFFCATQLAAQTTHYDYDLNGNRDFRYQVILRIAPQDSTDEYSAETEALFEDELLGMEDSWEQLVMKVYPNPTTHSVQVEMSGADVPQGEELRLINSSGKVLHQEKNFFLPLSVDMSHCPAGGYILWMRFPDGTVKRIKILKT